MCFGEKVYQWFEGDKKKTQEVTAAAKLKIP